MNIFNRLINNKKCFGSSGRKVESLNFKELFRATCYYVAYTQECSTSIIQRKFNVKFSDADRVVQILEKHKIVGPFEYKKSREVYITSVEDMEVVLDLLYKIK